MAIEIRLPNITGVSEKEQLLQLKSYLYQLSEQLQYAFDTINTTGGSDNGSYVVSQAPRAVTGSSGSPSNNAGISFAELKSLIIKSADIVDAYYEEITKKLVGGYIAESDFGTYVQQTLQEIELTPEKMVQHFENSETIIKLNDNIGDLQGDIAGANALIEGTEGALSALGERLGAAEGGVKDALDAVAQARADLAQSILDAEGKIPTTENLTKALLEATEKEVGHSLSLSDVGEMLTTLTGLVVEKGGIVSIGTEACIKSGLLYTLNGVAVYGLEVGQNTKIDGVEVYNKIARLTSEGLYFFDAKKYYDTTKSDADNAIAYISDSMLYISDAEITGSFKLGGFVDEVQPNGDVITRWLGGS